MWSRRSFYHDLAGQLLGPADPRCALRSNPVVVGPFWLRGQGAAARADVGKELARLAALPFAHLVAGHGGLVKDVANAELQAAVSRVL